MMVHTAHTGAKKQRMPEVLSLFFCYVRVCESVCVPVARVISPSPLWLYAWIYAVFCERQNSIGAKEMSGIGGTTRKITDIG